jgi:glycosyltransferase involved in cell wall biosynthesis
MFFSVVIPTHNRVLILLEALQSVRRQTFEDYEVIVVDDGSTDGTDKEVERIIADGGWRIAEGRVAPEDRRSQIGDRGQQGSLDSRPSSLDAASNAPRIRVLRQENAGPGAARNLGAREARGKYLAFLDSDDLWFPWTLETYREVIEKEKSPGFVAGCPFVFERKEQVDAVAKGYLQTKRFADYLESGEERRWWGVSSFVVKKSLFEQVGGFASEFVNGEDADFVMKCGVEPGFVQVLCPLTFGYRKHEANITKAFEKNLAGARLQIRNEKNGVYPGGKSRARERWHILSRQIRPVAVAALENRRPDAAWEIYKTTFWWHVALGKWKFLIGLPMAMAWRACAWRDADGGFRIADSPRVVECVGWEPTGAKRSNGRKAKSKNLPAADS